MKKIYLLLLLFVVFFASSTFAAPPYDAVVTWLHTNGITSMTNTIDFLPDNYMTREEASKFFSQLATNVFNKRANSNAKCNFNDLKNANSTLKQYITLSCQLGLMKGNAGKFNPTAKMTNAEAITVIVRIMSGDQNNTGGNRYNIYYDKAQSLGFLSSLTISNKNMANQNATRGNVGLLMYKSKYPNWTSSGNNNWNRSVNPQKNANISSGETHYTITQLYQMGVDGIANGVCNGTISKNNFNLLGNALAPMVSNAQGSVGLYLSVAQAINSKLCGIIVPLTLQSPPSLVYPIGYPGPFNVLPENVHQCAVGEHIWIIQNNQGPCVSNIATGIVGTLIFEDDWSGNTWEGQLNRKIIGCSIPEMTLVNGSCKCPSGQNILDNGDGNAPICNPVLCATGQHLTGAYNQEYCTWDTLNCPTGKHAAIVDASSRPQCEIDMLP